ncbi:hypothetical protein Tsubulata_043536 [Turnera subulata]|uniref:Uncharacterized protein n=1 Tax=Turnera subulata TaxID=218843 RepID=A0A9Q0FIK8_9ROSI|nr:hypothetical protein Tsubulata_043536 [Turnera subulata]
MSSKTAPPNSKSHTLQQNRTCLCSPTTHPGSFRCSLHRNSRRIPGRSWPKPAAISSSSSSSAKREAAMIAKVYSVKAFLLQIIKPSCHDLQRRRNFQPRPTRFCVMNANADAVAVS